MAGSPPAGLQQLPVELRLKIFSFFFQPASYRVVDDNDYITYDYRQALQLLLVNKATHDEAKIAFRRQNVFVIIEAPWEQTQADVLERGRVPVVLKDITRSNFSLASLRVAIDAPAMEALGIFADPQRFVVLKDDLHHFTRHWHRVNLEHEGLNGHLRLRLELLAPYTPDYEEKTMGKELQRELILPFGEVRGLQSVEYVGSLKPFTSVKKELEVLQGISQPTAEHYLREALKLLKQGNSALSAERYDEALVLYHQSWDAMLIEVQGSYRRAFADRFFSKTLTEEPFKDKNGQAERLLIRCELVANTCLAYLRLGDFTKCVFWGMRSITTLRQTLGIDGLVLPADEEVVTNFPAPLDFGHIYRWTACAYKEVGDWKQAVLLSNVAREYLPKERDAIDEDMAGLPQQPVV